MIKPSKETVFLISIAILFAVFACAAGASDPPDKDQFCLNCHGKKDAIMKFQNNDSMSVFVNTEHFRNSIHKSFSCPQCHTEFSTTAHPERKFRSKEQYRIKTSLLCRRCHKDEAIRNKSIHASLLSREKKGHSPICSDCHSAHSMPAILGGKAYSTEEKFCMGCHGHEMLMTFKNSDTLAMKIDAKEIHASAHRHLSCSDCHFGFSSESHVKRDFKSRREYSLASSAVCTRCHFDKYTRTIESIHYTLLSQGNLNAPSCIDCHGSHSIPFITEDRTTSALKCKRCHERVYDTYSKSVHGAALISENNRDVPVCIDCHTAHDIRSPLTKEYHERIPEMCSNCHSNKAIVGKYGLSTDVVKTYLSDFHGITLSFYKNEKPSPYKPMRPIAVCTDCHGTHNIKSTIEPDATVVKANLVNVCRKCHANAADNFPDTWLSHYVPNLSNAPMVYIVNTAYKVLMPFMLIGLLLQILLHIWRYLVNR